MISLEQFENDKWSTVGFLSLPKGDRPQEELVVMVHAGASSKTGHRDSFVYLQNILDQSGVASFRFDLPKDGESRIFSVDIDRLEAVEDLLIHMQMKYNFQKMILLGHCYGALNVLHQGIKGNLPVKGIFLWHITPILYGIAQGKKKWTAEISNRLNDWHNAFDRSFSLKYLPRIAKHTLHLLEASMRYGYYKIRKSVTVGSELQEKPTKKFNEIPVWVIINPSVSHYKDMETGQKFLHEELSEYGYKNVNFEKIGHKVFSRPWQKEAFKITADRINECLEKENETKTLSHLVEQ